MFWSNHILFHEVPRVDVRIYVSKIRIIFKQLYLSLVHVIWLTFTGSNGSG